MVRDKTGIEMLPALRFMLGASLASLLLILTVLGLAATVRLAQQAKVSPLKPARTLAYASPAGGSEFDYDDRARHFEAAAGIVPLRRDESLIGAASSKPVEEPEQHAQSQESPNQLLASTKPKEERIETVPPQESPFETTASIPAVGEEAELSSDTATPVDTGPASPVRGPIEPNQTAEAAASAEPTRDEEPAGGDAAVIDEPEIAAATFQPEVTAPMAVAPSIQPSEGAADLTQPSETAPPERGASGKRAQSHGAHMQKKTQKSKAATRPTKVKKTVAKQRTPPVTNPLAAGIGFPQPQNGSNAEGKIFAAPPATKLASSQLCGLGSAPCSRPLLRASGSRQMNFKMSRTRRP